MPQIGAETGPAVRADGPRSYFPPSRHLAASDPPQWRCPRVAAVAVVEL